MGFGKVVAALGLLTFLCLPNRFALADTSPPLGTNLIPNASFETAGSGGLLPEGWSLVRQSQDDPPPLQFPDATAPEWAGDPGAQTGDRYIKFVVSTENDLTASETSKLQLDELIPVKTDTDYRLEMSYRFETVDERATGGTRLAMGVTAYYDANPGGDPDPREIPLGIPNSWVGSLCCGYPPPETLQWRHVLHDFHVDNAGTLVDGAVRQVAWVRLGLEPNNFFQGTVAVDDVSLIELASAKLDAPESSLAFDFVPRSCNAGSAEVGETCVSDSECPGIDTDDDGVLDTVGACVANPTAGFTAAPFNRQFSGEGNDEYGFAFEDLSSPPEGIDLSGYPTRHAGNYMGRNTKFRVALAPGDYRVSLYMGGLWRNEPTPELHVVDFNGETLIDEIEDWVDVNALRDHWYFKNVEATLVTSDHVSPDRRGYAVYDDYIAPRFRRHDVDLTVSDEGEFSNLLEIQNRSGFMSAVVITPASDLAGHDAAISDFDLGLPDEFVTHFANYHAPEDFGLPTVQGDYVPTSEDEDRGYVIFQRHWMDFVEFNSRPESGEPALSGLSLAATPGEFEPTTFSIWPQQMLGNSAIAVSDLQIEGGSETIPAENVGVWYLQQKPRRDGTVFSFVGVYLPDWGASRTLYPDVTQRVWLNVKVPEDAEAGVYTGEVTFTADGIEPTELPLTLEVRPFRLRRSPHVRSLRGAGGVRLILSYPSSDPDAPGQEDPPIHNREYYRKAAYQDLYDHGFTPDISPYFNGPLVSASSCFWDSNGDFVWSCGTIAGSADDQLDRFAASPFGEQDTMWVDATFSRLRNAFKGNAGSEWGPEDVADWLADIEAKLHGERGMNKIYLHATSEEDKYSGSAWTDLMDFVRTYRNTGYAGSGSWPHIYTTHTANTIDGQPEAIDHNDFPFLGMFHGVSVPDASEQIAAAKATGKPYGIYGIRGRFVAGFFHWKSGATGSFHEFYENYFGTLNDDWDTSDQEMGENPGWTNALYSQSGRMVGNWHWEALREGVDDDAYMTSLDFWIGLYDCEQSATQSCADALEARQAIADAIDLDGAASPLDSEDTTSSGRYSRSGLNLNRPMEPAAYDALREQAADAIVGLLGPDSDGDWIPDQVDNCLGVDNPYQEDTDENGIGDACNAAEDADDDEWADGLDNCADATNPGQEDADGNGTGDACNSAEDMDDDEWADALDNCAANSNPGQEDTDGNGTGDACNSAEDTDDDDWADGLDNCPAAANTGQGDQDGDLMGDVCDPDRDGDGIANENDNCADMINPNQGDADGNGTGDACNQEEDADNDEWADGLDNCAANENPGQEDQDGDQIGDVCDPDRDGDEIANEIDNCVEIPNLEQEDFDADDVGDSCDNCVEYPNALQEDANFDGFGNGCDADFDDDGDVDDEDSAFMMASNGAQSPAPLFNPVLDMVPNDRINGQDSQIRFSYYYHSDPPVPGPSGLACSGSLPGDPSFPCRSRSDDADGDGQSDATDNCPNHWNPAQADSSGSGTGDACLDSDNDGLFDFVETDTGVYVSEIDTGTDPNNPDTDGDGFSDGEEVERGMNPVVMRVGTLPALHPISLLILALLFARIGTRLARSSHRPTPRIE